MKATYVKTHLQSIVNVSKIVTVHYYEFDKNFVFEGESHDFWEMVYVDKGKVLISGDGVEKVLTQGELIFHRPNEFHSIRALDSSPNFFVVSFVSTSPSMVFFEKYSTKLDNTLKPFISAIIKEAERTFVIPKNDPNLKKLKKKENAPFGGEQLIKTYLEQLLILIIRGDHRREDNTIFPSKESMETHLVVAAKRLINDNLDKPIRVTDLCRELGYSKSYLSKLFRDQTGDTIAAYAIKKKISKAKELIRESELNFTQISDRLAFDNSQYFSRVFKRVTGMSPSEFKFSLDFSDLKKG